MSTAAQVLANRSNAQASTGPVTAEGKSTVSRNAIKLGLYSVTAFIRPGEQPEFDDLSRGLTAELRPQTTLELTLVREIIHASWRLRRCALAEIEVLADADDPDRLQTSIDRARAAAHRTLFRSLNELRRLRAARPGPFDEFAAERTGGHSGRALCALEKEANRGLTDLRLLRAFDQAQPNQARPDPAKQTQSTQSAAPTPAPAIARNALCPCGSGDKFKRCCGKSAPPVLHTRAA